MPTGQRIMCRACITHPGRALLRLGAYRLQLDQVLSKFMGSNRRLYGRCAARVGQRTSSRKVLRAVYVQRALDRRRDEETYCQYSLLITSGYGQLDAATQAPRHVHPNRQAVTTGSQAVRLAGVHRGPRRTHSRLPTIRSQSATDMRGIWPTNLYGHRIKYQDK